MKIATFMEPGKMVITEIAKPVIEKERQMQSLKLYVPVFAGLICGGIVASLNAKLTPMQVTRRLEL